MRVPEDEAPKNKRNTEHLLRSFRNSKHIHGFVSPFSADKRVFLVLLFLVNTVSFRHIAHRSAQYSVMFRMCASREDPSTFARLSSSIEHCTRCTHIN